MQYWPYGDQGEDFESPYWIANREMFTNHKHRYMFNASAVFDITDWIRYYWSCAYRAAPYSARINRFYATSYPLLTGDNVDEPREVTPAMKKRYKQTYADIITKYRQDFL